MSLIYVIVVLSLTDFTHGAGVAGDTVTRIAVHHVRTVTVVSTRITGTFVDFFGKKQVQYMYWYRYLHVHVHVHVYQSVQLYCQSLEVGAVKSHPILLLYQR